MRGVPQGAVKGGRSPAERTLDGAGGTRQSSKAECRRSPAFGLGSERPPDMQNQLFEAALDISKPWYVRGVDFDAARKVLTIGTTLSPAAGSQRRVSKARTRSMTIRPSGCDTS